MKQYRAQPRYVEAIQLTRENADEVAQAAQGRARIVTEHDALDDEKTIKTIVILQMGGGDRMSIGDWLVVEGKELTVMSDREFQTSGFEETDA